MSKLFKNAIALTLALFISFTPALADDMADRQKVAQEIIDVTITVGVVKQMTAATWPTVAAGIKAKNPEVSEETFEKLHKEYSLMQQNLMGQILVGLPEIYATEFTLDELKELLVFSKSAVGQKMLVVQPKIMQQIMPKMMQVMQSEMPALIQRFQEIIKEHGLKTQEL
jgi:hypothetical protein